MTVEMGLGVFILFIALFMLVAVIAACVSYRIAIIEEQKRERNTPRELCELTMEQVQKMVEDQLFWELAEKIASGKADESCTNFTNMVELLVPCESPRDCPCDETRADCCNGLIGEDGKLYCKKYFNLNKNCDVDENGNYIDPRKLLTDAEIKQMSQIVEKLKGEN